PNLSSLRHRLHPHPRHAAASAGSPLRAAVGVAPAPSGGSPPRAGSWPAVGLALLGCVPRRRPLSSPPSVPSLTFSNTLPSPASSRRPWASAGARSRRRRARSPVSSVADASSAGELLPPFRHARRQSPPPTEHQAFAPSTPSGAAEVARRQLRGEQGRPIPALSAPSSAPIHQPPHSPPPHLLFPPISHEAGAAAATVASPPL
ncbi:unnamed protein product, partial [Urochloa humidicola]